MTLILNTCISQTNKIKIKFKISLNTCSNKVFSIPSWFIKFLNYFRANIEGTHFLSLNTIIFVNSFTNH